MGTQALVMASWCKQVFQEEYIVPADGIVNFVVPGSSISQQTRSLKIKASYRKSSTHFTVNKAWSSPSNSFVEMTRLTSPQVVGSTAKVTFTFTAKQETENITFHYQVFSRGKLVTHGRKLHVIDYNKTMTFTNYKMKSMFTSRGFLEFNVTHEMVPSCRILLFYVREDKETVAATMQFDTEATLENEVKIQFADTQRQPGEKTRLIIKAAKGSKVAITAVDRSVHFLEEGNELTEADAIKALRSQDVGPYGSDSCWPTGLWPFRQRRSAFPWYRHKKDLDSSKAFRVRCKKIIIIIMVVCNEIYFPGGRLNGAPRMVLMTGANAGIQPLMETIGDGDTVITKQSSTKRKPVNVRKEFPETWLWTEQVVNDRSGKMVLSVKVPDTITSWVASAFAMSNSSGLGISKPTSLKVFQPFFVSLTLPYSVIRGEEVSVIATVFNYENKCLTVSVALMQVTAGELFTCCLQWLAFASNEAKSVNFGIVPKALGQVPLSLFAKDIKNSSACWKRHAQMHLGVSDAVIRKLLVEVDSLLRLPYGCGEQNMVNFAPSIYIVKYLSSVEQLSESIENKAKNIMRTGYQRELTYKRDDGSYSAFGKRDSEGNMWYALYHFGGVTTEATLTAFVTVSLLESGMSSGHAIIEAALNCLKSSFQSNLTDSYTLSLFAYTFTLAKDPQSSVLFASLKEKAITEGELMHWEKVKEISNSHSNEFFWWNPYLRAPAADIEMTSYALMTYVLLAEDDPSMIGEAMPIVRWLTKQRNALGGFASTQVPASILPIKKLPFKVNGEGCALVQADVSYNIPDVTDEPAFGLNVTLQPSDDMFAPMATQSGELLCLPLEMFITAEWLKEGTSNMAVVDVKLVSGYQVDEDSLKKLLNVRSLGIKRYEMEGQHVILYLDEIDKVSFSFKIYQSAVVKKTKPAAVTVYDYYETDLSATKMYKITKDLCGPDEMP
ncbi:Pregnancy zone protein [Acropora cervicornis]|uniref:Pregnancy zone protein n=1 Tax=Acropora cervicornis TaxID=6130 RepID=A0AAD9QVC7_ACRCE|nr:Pregnancy zone protein [Acropora cervicornis]